MSDVPPDTNVVRLVEVGRPDLNDIPARMEAVAASIRNGEVAPAAAVAVFIDESGELVVYGWGKTETIHSVGLLNLGAIWLATNALGAAD